MTSIGLGLCSIAIVRRYTIKPSHSIRRTNRNQKRKSRWNSKEISQRNQQSIWKTQNDPEMTEREITIEIKMIITVYVSEENVNSVRSRCTIFGCIGTTLRPFMRMRSIKMNQRRMCQGYEVWMERKEKIDALRTWNSRQWFVELVLLPCRGTSIAFKIYTDALKGLARLSYGDFLSKLHIPGKFFFDSSWCFSFK